MLVEALILPVGVHHMQTIYEAVVFTHEECVDSCEGRLFTGPTISYDKSKAVSGLRLGRLSSSVCEV
jgi:hypothetical protein